MLSLCYSPLIAYMFNIEQSLIVCVYMYISHICGIAWSQMGGRKFHQLWNVNCDLNVFNECTDQYTVHIILVSILRIYHIYRTITIIELNWAQFVFDVKINWVYNNKLYKNATKLITFHSEGNLIVHRQLGPGQLGTQTIRPRQLSPQTIGPADNWARRQLGPQTIGPADNWAQEKLGQQTQ